MKIFDKESNKDFKGMCLLFTVSEAMELSREFKKLLENPSQYTINLKGEDLDGKSSKKLFVKIHYPKNVELCTFKDF